MRLVVLGTLLTLLASLGAVAPAPAAAPPSSEDRPAAERAAAPKLRVTRLVTGLDHPWDVRPIGQGRLLFTERDRATVSLWTGERVRTVRFPSGKVWVSGETGLMGLEVDPDFADNRRFYTCQGGRTGNGHDVRVIAWRLNPALTRAKQIKKLIGGLPATSGRHGGCRLLIARNGALLVGTGDAAVGRNPRNLTSLGGKTLRLDRFTGRAWPTNPFRNAKRPKKRFVFTYGHRNVQGLAQRADGSLWSIEQGSYRDDEVNRLRKGGDYGWHPVPGYNESVPMTDQSLPGKQRGAKWRSGQPTIATSGGDFVRGKRWGAYDGALAVGALAGQRVLFLTFKPGGKLQQARAPQALRQHGRIRTAVDGPGAKLYLTTDNGRGDDAILLVRPHR